MNELVNYEGVFRTAPATPGLLINGLNLGLADVLILFGLSGGVLCF